jgi:two-component system response regulator VicR
MAKRILVVDDKIEDLENMRSLLEKEGYEVLTAANGAEAIDLMKTCKCDLILIDILMPTFSGYDLLRLLREKMNHNVKMVYVSIVPKKDVDLEGIDGFIQKPFSAKTFISTVKRVLGNRR